MEEFREYVKYKTDGGPAFPGKAPEVLVHKDCTHVHSIQVQKNGMSLRDWFAGMALQGMIARKAFEEYEEAAIHAYEYADAMLKKREK